MEQLETGPSTYPFVTGIGHRRSFRWLVTESLITGHRGGLAQLGEHLLCKQGVTGSIPVASTKLGPTKHDGASSGVAYRILVLPVLAPSALRAVRGASTTCR